MIPKTIHYCWFGRNPKPKLAEKCISSWEKFCPDFEIMEWNEDNFDISECPLYVRQAYNAKKWAYVTDYVRLKVVYDNGGIYLDTDVELIKSLNELLQNHAYFGFEDGKFVATGLGFGAEKGASILLELMNDYTDIPFINKDGTLDKTTCPQRNTAVFVNHGLLQNNTKQLVEKCLILPSSYLCPINYTTGKQVIAPHTISIHHFSASWQSPAEKKQHKKNRASVNRQNLIHYILHIPNLLLRTALGPSRYNRIKSFFKRG